MTYFKIGLISLDRLKKFPKELFLKLLFETRVAHDIRCALEKIIMEVSRHIQPRISSFAVK